MSTATLTREQTRTTALFSDAKSTLGSNVEIEHEMITGENGNPVLWLKRVPVFRSGEFKDSMGYEHLWEDFHMQQMAMHYEYLSTSGIFGNVPIRADHPSFLGGGIITNVIGYHASLVAEKMKSPVDGEEYTYLLADMHIIREDAQKAILDGLWRTRSAEIGPYESNNKAELWPVYMGVAYVDIPAVEGLEQHLKRYTKSGNKFSLMMEESMTGSTVVPATQPPAAAPKFEFALPGQSTDQKTTDFAAVQATLNEQYTKIQTLTAEKAAQETELTTLRGFAKESKDAVRVAFVKGLIDTGKILAPMKEDTEKLVIGFDDAQFAAYSKIMEGAPTNPVVGQYGSQPVNTGAPGSTPNADPSAEEKAILIDQLQLHKRSGRTADELKAFKSYARLAELDKATAESLLK